MQNEAGGPPILITICQVKFYKLFNTFTLHVSLFNCSFFFNEKQQHRVGSSLILRAGVHCTHRHPGSRYFACNLFQSVHWPQPKLQLPVRPLKAKRIQAGPPSD